MTESRAARAAGRGGAAGPSGGTRNGSRSLGRGDGDGSSIGGRCLCPEGLLQWWGWVGAGPREVSHRRSPRRHLGRVDDERSHSGSVPWGRERESGRCHFTCIKGAGPNTPNLIFS